MFGRKKPVRATSEAHATDTESMPRMNGHPIMKGMPGIRMFRTASRVAVRISMDCPGTEDGRADIYVHKNCVRYVSGMNSDTVYDVMLLDRDYELYKTHTVPETGQRYLIADEERVPVSEVIKMMQATKRSYLRNEAKLTDIFDKRRACPDDMISYQYLVNDESVAIGV